MISSSTLKENVLKIRPRSFFKLKSTTNKLPKILLVKLLFTVFPPLITHNEYLSCKSFKQQLKTRLHGTTVDHFINRFQTEILLQWVS